MVLFSFVREKILIQLEKMEMTEKPISDEGKKSNKCAPTCVSPYRFCKN